MMKMDLGAGTTPPINVAAAKPNEETTGNFINTTKDKKVFKQGKSSSYSCSGDENKRIDIQEISNLLTQQAMAIGYGKLGLRVFPCNKDKSPIVDQSLGFKHGVKDATSDTQIIAKTWFRYPDAAIGFAIPRDIMVIDCDVKKDPQKKPLLKNGLPDRIGLRSFNRLIMELKITGDPLYTLSVNTQSGGRHFYFRMPDGVPSFNHTGALEGLDLKGFGGYVILPNSLGLYGRYEFLNRSEIRQIPESLLKWVLKFKEHQDNPNKIRYIKSRIDREEVVRILAPYWQRGDGRRNELTLSIAGFIARSGGNEQDAVYIVSKLCDLTKKGYDHISGSKYAFRRNGSVKGLRSLLKLMEEIANEKQ